MTKEKEEIAKFSFNNTNKEIVDQIIAKYPVDRKKSATLPLLDLAQRQNNGWLSTDVIEHVASILDVPYMRVYEVASFYSMFNLKPVGKYHIQVCGTTPCWLKGAEDIKKRFENAASVRCGDGISEDGLFTISEFECLGACVDAPVVQINDDYYENLDEQKVDQIVLELKNSSR